MVYPSQFWKGKRWWLSEHLPSGSFYSPCSSAWSPRATGSDFIKETPAMLYLTAIRHGGRVWCIWCTPCSGRNILNRTSSDPITRRLLWDRTSLGCIRSGRWACRSRCRSRSAGGCSAASMYRPIGRAGVWTRYRSSFAGCSAAASRSGWTGSGTPSPFWRSTPPCS